MMNEAAEIIIGNPIHWFFVILAFFYGRKSYQEAKDFFLKSNH